MAAWMCVRAACMNVCTSFNLLFLTLPLLFVLLMFLSLRPSLQIKFPVWANKRTELNWTDLEDGETVRMKFMDEEKKGKRVQAFITISPRVPHFPGVGLNPVLELFYFAPGTLCIHSFWAVDFGETAKRQGHINTFVPSCIFCIKCNMAWLYQPIFGPCLNTLLRFLHTFSTRRQHFMDNKCVKCCKFSWQQPTKSPSLSPEGKIPTLPEKDAAYNKVLITLAFL